MIAMLAGGKWKTYGIIALIVIIIIAVIYFSGKKAGKGNKPPKEIKLPSSGSGIPAGWSALPLAKRLYEAMKGVTWWDTNREDILTELATLPSDDMFVAVYNQFNTSFGDGETLRTWINDEYNVSSGVKGRLEQRFDSLNLS